MEHCRVCVAEVENVRSLVASCCMPVSQGMVVTTNSPRVLTARRLVGKLLWSSGDHNCLQCEKNGNCELQPPSVYTKYLKGEIAMPRWKYKTSIVDLNSVVPPDSISCDDTGTCIVDGIPGGQDPFKGILDKEGESEWELVQCQTHGGKLLCIWKKEVKEAFAS